MDHIDDIFSLASELGLDVPESVPEYTALSAIASQVGYDDYSYTPSGNAELYNRLLDLSSQNDDRNSNYEMSDPADQMYEGSSNESGYESRSNNENYLNNNNSTSGAESSDDDGSSLKNRLRKKQYQNEEAKRNALGNKGVGANKAQLGNAAKDAAENTAKDAAKEAAKKEVADAAKKKAAKKAAKSATSNVAKKAGTKALLKSPYFWAFVGIVVLFIALIIFLCIIFAGSTNDSVKYGSGKYTYVKMNYTDTVVLNSDSGTTSMDMDDYVACVLNAEVGMHGESDEFLKAFSIAIRSNAQQKMASDKSLPNNTGFQVCKVEEGVTDKGSKLHNIADETSGVVMVTGSLDSPNFYYASYDELAYNESCGGEDKGDSLVTCQGKVEISKSWLNSKGESTSRIDYLKDHEYHGQGMSEWGAYYLAVEKNYDADALLEYFYGKDNVKTISLYPPMPSPNDGNCEVTLEIKSSPASAKEITTTLKNFFSSKGTSIQAINDGLLAEVTKAGPGTRCGVVTAALYTVNSLLQYNARLPYHWGGGSGGYGDCAAASTYGFCPSWGTYSPVYANGHKYAYTGIDCGRYVTWMFLNGGVKTYSSEQTKYHANYGSGQFTDKIHTTRHDVKNTSEYIGQPGDVFTCSNGNHAELILKYVENGSSKGYYVAHASGYGKGIKVNYASISDLASSSCKVVDMSWYYENQATKDYQAAFQNGRKDK